MKSHHSSRLGCVSWIVWAVGNGLVPPGVPSNQEHAGGFPRISSGPWWLEQMKTTYTFVCAPSLENVARKFKTTQTRCCYAPGLKCAVSARPLSLRFFWPFLICFDFASPPCKTRMKRTSGPQSLRECRCVQLAALAKRHTQLRNRPKKFCTCLSHAESFQLKHNIIKMTHSLI